MKKIFAAILAAIFVFTVWQTAKIYRQSRALDGELSGIAKKKSDIERENERLKEDIEYFSHSANLEKELRSRFNYKKLGEKMLIIISPKSDND